MKTFFCHTLFGLMLLLMPSAIFAQAPDLGAASSFAVFTGIGAFNNDGTTVITGDIGTNIGPFAGFPPGTVQGTIHVQDAVSLQASIGVGLAYSYLSAITCDVVLGVGLGNNQVLSPNVYCIGAAATLNGDLILDGQNDPDALFIFQIDGALSTGVNSRVMLINGASLCNVYWQINGAVELGDLSIFRGTFIANGQIEALEGATIFGRALATVGAISLHNNVIRRELPPIPADITANGPTTFCEGNSVVLSGNINGIWNTGETTPTITVTTSGDYFVTNSNACGSEASNHIIVTVNPLPPCDINGIPEFCAGQSTELCASPGFAAYDWSTGATSDCITVTSAGTYSLTVTDANGCESVCSQIVTENPIPGCDITGVPTICSGQSTELCASPGFVAYSWSTGATSDCITVTSAGTYSVTVTDANGCESVCSQIVTENPVPVCNITGNPISCTGESTELCTTPGFASYLWSTGEMTNCIMVSTPGLFSVTVTDANGCSSSCDYQVMLVDDTPPVITCPIAITIECDESTLPANTGTATATDNCTLSPLISFNDAIVAGGLCPQINSIMRIWTATYSNGNSITCIQTISIEDTTAPVISINNPLLTNGDTITVPCFGQDPNWNLPNYDEGSVTATDDCGGSVAIAFTHTLENEGTCEEDGYISLFRLTWTATDLCGNSSNVVLFLSLVDNTPPVIFGVPDDITIECEAIPALPEFVYATDECLCACIVFFEETRPTASCLDGQVLVRTWTATDGCGNTTTETQNITLIDSTGPEWVLDFPEIGSPAPGAIFEYTCEEGGIPAFFSFLNEEAVYDASSCGTVLMVAFDSVTVVSNNCIVDGFVAQTTYRWEGYDECGNSSELVFYARLVDHEAPVLIGVPDTSCLGSPALDEISATDDCTQPTIHFWDVNLPNSCGNEMVLRTYEAVDACGNTSRATTVIITDGESTPVISFSNPMLASLGTSDTLRLDCAASGQYTSFGMADVIVENACAENVTISFSETLVSTSDCSVNGVIALVELKWTATAICGNTSELSIMANMVDESSPVFPDFEAEMTIRCDDPLPVAFATDNCGEVTLITVDTLIQGACAFEYYIKRLITATDPCGNAATRQQIIHVGNGEGPTMEGLDADVICKELTLPDVTAYDFCVGEFVPVTMVQDTLESICEGMVIRRTWTAVNSCGYVSEVSQIIIRYDETPPVISIPNNSVIHDYLYYQPQVVYLGQLFELEGLDALNAYSVIVSDDCGETIIPVFTLVITSTEDCEAAGYFEERIYTWIATDICGNSTTLTFTVNIIDDVPPVLRGVPDDLTIECAPLPPVPAVFTGDTNNSVTIVYTQTIEDGDEPGVFIVTRTWVATDACGNTTVKVQTITWIPDTILECTIILPENVECNSHGVVISSTFTGGVNYDWEIVGGECFIQGGQNTPEITIYVGWSTVKIILTVTDSFGCSSMCMVFLDCRSSYSLNTPGTIIERVISDGSTISEVNTTDHSTGTLQNFSLWPNPVSERVFLGFDATVEEVVEIRLISSFGQVLLGDKITAQKGANSYMINVSELPKGSYLVQVKTEKELLTKVIIVL